MIHGSNRKMEQTIKNKTKNRDEDTQYKRKPMMMRLLQLHSFEYFQHVSSRILTPRTLSSQLVTEAGDSVDQQFALNKNQRQPPDKEQRRLHPNRKCLR